MTRPTATSRVDERLCSWCRINPVQGRKVFCSQLCRQTAFRLRQRGEPLITAARGDLVFGYADPPYLKLSKKFYQHRANYQGEVDHARLIAQMTDLVRKGKWAGWALSASRKSLRQLLPLVPEATDVCAWTKPIGVPSTTYGRHSTWEPVLVFGGRKRRPGVRDWLSAQPARGGGDLPGRKPIAFCSWLFDLLGMLPGDDIVDLFPGSGVVGRSWEEISRYGSVAARAETINLRSSRRSAPGSSDRA